jgi:inosose dehydratase
VTDIPARLAGAPITWGICEVPGWGHQLRPERVLREMRSIGLRATELGPDGYLPTEPSRLRALLASFGLRLVGGFVPLTLHRRDLLEAEVARAGKVADALAAMGGEMFVLAAATGEGGYEGSSEIGAAEWEVFVDGIGRVVEVVADRELVVALHPHHGTMVERADHVERMLESTAVSLCLDTGHLMIGGADPVEIARTARGRVAHVHLKDVSAPLADQVRAGSAGYHEAVRLGMYRPLGHGDVDVGGVVRELERDGYAGWYVLEQDSALTSAPEVGDGPLRDASASVAFIRGMAADIDSGVAANG